MASVGAGGAGRVGGQPTADGADQGQAGPAARLAPGASAAAPTLQDLVAILARSVKRLDDAAEKAVSGGNGAALAAASGQLHKGVELLSRLVGAHGPADDRAAPQINIILGSPPASVPAVEGMRVIDEDGRAQDGAAFTMRLTASGAASAAVPPSLAKPQEAAIAPDPAAASLSPAVPSAQQSGESAPAFVCDLKMPEFQL
nr:hypothetical protein [uncultured Acidocella sp.]